MLNWADINKFQCEVKGGVIEIRPKVMIVTCNMDIKDLCMKSGIKEEV